MLSFYEIRAKNLQIIPKNDGFNNKQMNEVLYTKCKYTFRVSGSRLYLLQDY